MKTIIQILLLSFFVFIISSCSIDNSVINSIQMPTKNIKYLALGDSYTIGQSVCETCRYPIQLQDSLKKILKINDSFSTQIIAQTGWTTSNLKAAIATANPDSNFDLVTLLIGVNNQYQNKSFSLYEQEFPELVNQAISFAKGKKENIIVISIPDYAFTPFGHGSASISEGINLYNNFAQNYCSQNGITFLNITDISRLGLEQPNLVATDGLHPSELAYQKFVERIYPIAKLKLGL